MSANPRLTAYLDDHKIRYDIKPHSHSYSSIGTAIAAEVSPRKLAKAVVLEDHQGRHMMAVVPTDNKISIRSLGNHWIENFTWPLSGRCIIFLEIVHPVRFRQWAMHLTWKPL